MTGKTTTRKSTTRKSTASTATPAHPTVKGNPVYQYVTDRIISALEAGTIPWRKPWAMTGKNQAINYVSRKAYRGINTILLPMPGEYLTYQQAKNAGGSVREGEKGYMVVFYKTVVRKNENADTPDEEERRYGMLRYYLVFHISQCENIVSKSTSDTTPVEPIEAAEQLLARYRTAPRVVHGGDVACYNPWGDWVGMPEKAQFNRMQEYYNTLAHEFAHSTGHESRMNRWANQPSQFEFGNESYSMEELRAEISAAMFCTLCGIDQTTFSQSAGYIAHWLEVFKNDNKIIVRAAGDAQKIIDYMTDSSAINAETEESEAA